MDRRLKLDAELREILGLSVEETGHLYFQPTEEVRMKYDAIVYKVTSMRPQYANNRTYNLRDEYQVTVITRDPDSDLPRKLQEHFELCSPGRKFVSDNLYHFPFTLYY